MKWWRWTLAAMLVALAASAGGAQTGRPPLSVEELKSLVESADLLLVVQVESQQGNPTADTRLTWEVQAKVLEALKGTLAPPRISIHVESIVRAFDREREQLPGAKYLVPLKPLGDPGGARFQLVGRYAFAADGDEAGALRELAEAEAQRGSGGETLRLLVQPLESVFQPDRPKPITLRLANEGETSATYLQAPLAEHEGKLYLLGQGAIRIRDAAGNVVPDRGNVLAGQVPPTRPNPALILPKASFVETVDLAKYYDLKPGRYTLVLMLATPTGRGRIPSNGLSLQVGALNLPEGSPLEGLPSRVEPGAVQAAPSLVAPKLPDPSQYAPGEPRAGLAALLRPEKAVFAVGDPVTVELRLVNRGPRTVSVDARLERALTIKIAPVGDSPQPLFVQRVIVWGETEGKPEERAYLREGAFWGRMINLNMLYGKKLDEIQAPAAAEIAAGKDLSYERFGRNLYAFPKPGTYRVTATYAVARPSGGNADPDWWIGEVEANPILIGIAPAEEGPAR